MALRFDITKLDDPRRDHNGYLVADAHATRTGVFVYHHPDGSTTRELRHPDDVFKTGSVNTLKNRPLTDGHPLEGKVDSSNTKRLAVGMTIENPKHGDRYIDTKIQITDETVIERVLTDDNPLRELSCGYEAEIVKEDGVYQGEEYDHRQTNIKYNHIALVKRGRAGPEVRLQLDEEDAAGDGLEDFVKTDIETTEEKIHIPVRGNEQFKEGSFRTIKLKGVEGVSLVTAKLKNPTDGKEGSMVSQKFIFDKNKFNMEQAKEFVSKNKGDAADDLVVDFQETDKTIEIDVKGFNMFVPKSFRTVDIKGVDGVQVLVGRLNRPHSGKAGSDTPQKYIFDKEKFSVSEAKAFIAKRGDSADLVKIKDIDQTSNRDKPKPRGDSDMIKIKRDAVKIRAFNMDAFELQIEDNVESGEKAVELVIDRLDVAIAHIKTLEGELDHKQGRIDALGDQGKVSLSKLNDLVKDRTDAINAAHYLGLTDYMDMETEALKKAVVCKAYPQVKLDDLTSDHIEGRYDTIIEGIKTENNNLKSMQELKSPAGKGSRFPVRADEGDPRSKFLEDTQNMYMSDEQRKLSA